MVLAALAAFRGAAGAAQLAGPEWPDIIPELVERDGFPSYPVVRLSVAVAIVIVIVANTPTSHCPCGRWVVGFCGP
jgi:hypothetical protein